MIRRNYLKAIGAGIISAGVGVTASSAQSSPNLVNPGFEDATRGWTIGRDLPADTDTSVPVDSSASITDEYASAGELSLELYIDGTQDDGTIWAQQPVDLSAVDTLEVDVWSPGDWFNDHSKVAVYAGPLPDWGFLVEEDFDTSEAIENHDGWKTFEYDVLANGEGVVAAGFSVFWETDITRYVDEIRLL